VRNHAKELQRLGEKYDAQWTPAILMLDPSGQERHRIEGFLPLSEFLPQIEFGRARIDFSFENYAPAERRPRTIVQQWPEAEIAPEALYWAGVSKYKASNDSSALQQTAAAFREKYRDSSWAKKRLCGLRLDLTGFDTRAALV
jgi:hypothetical protein